MVQLQFLDCCQYLGNFFLRERPRQPNEDIHVMYAERFVAVKPSCQSFVETYAFACRYTEDLCESTSRLLQLEPCKWTVYDYFGG